MLVHISTVPITNTIYIKKDKEENPKIKKKIVNIILYKCDKIR